MNTPANNSMAPTPPNRSHTGMSIWDVPIELANRVYTLAYVALVIGAVLTAISTMSLFWASAIRDKYADGQIQVAKRDAAQATENAGVANRQAGEARAAAALATERGNALAVEAERARVEQERLKLTLEREQVERLKFEAQFAWRTLSPEQRQAIKAELTASPGSVLIEFVSSDPESTFVAIQFERIFREAKWTVGFSANTYAGSVFLGIIVPEAIGSSTEAVRRALTHAHIGFQTGKPPDTTMSFTSPGGPDSARLIIGSKPTPLVERALGAAPADDTPPQAQPSRQ